jgi:hypothetical protein
MGMSGGCSWCTGHGSGTTQNPHHISHSQFSRRQSEIKQRTIDIDDNPPDKRIEVYYRAQAMN